MRKHIWGEKEEFNFGNVKFLIPVWMLNRDAKLAMIHKSGFSWERSCLSYRIKVSSSDWYLISWDRESHPERLYCWR